MEFIQILAVNAAGWIPGILLFYGTFFLVARFGLKRAAPKRYLFTGFFACVLIVTLIDAAYEVATEGTRLMDGERVFSRFDNVLSVPFVASFLVLFLVYALAARRAQK